MEGVVTPPVVRRQAYFKLVIIAATLLAGVIAWFAWPHKSHPRRHAELLDGGTFFGPHEQLGFRELPGSFRFRLTADGARGELVFAATVDAERNRITSAHSAVDGDTRPGVWLCGCSCTWGYGVDDKETYPWLLQEQLPQVRIKNLAGNAHGQVHELLQLQANLQGGKRPAAAVFTFCDFHLRRNAATPRWRHSLETRSEMQDVRLARARVESDRLQIDTIPLAGVPGEPDHELPDAELTRLAWRLFDEILSTCQAHGIKAILAYQYGKENDHAVVEHARRQGFMVVDIRLPPSARESEYSCRPYDEHPNARAHQYFADRLEPILCGQVLGH